VALSQSQEQQKEASKLTLPRKQHASADDPQPDEKQSNFEQYEGQLTLVIHLINLYNFMQN
jgi:hypothetical protein